MSRIDYSKWDKLNYSSSSEEDDKKARATIVHLGDLLLSSSQRTSSSSPLYGLVLHHKDIFVSHVLPKLNGLDRFFFSRVNRESQDVLEYAGVNVAQLNWSIHECSSISTLEFAWNSMGWGEKDARGNVVDQAWFCWQVSATNKLEFLKWAREVKHCEWDKNTIYDTAARGNLEMLKYCFDNDCPYDKKASCKQAACGGHLDCLRFLFAKVKPSRDTEKEVALQAASYSRINILKYLDEERKISDAVKRQIVYDAAANGRLVCLKYLVEEAKAPLDNWQDIASARYYEHPDCVNYLLEEGCPEPSDEEYAWYVEKAEKADAREREAAS
jgi:hypothetical protein